MCVCKSQCMYTCPSVCTHVPVYVTCPSVYIHVSVYVHMTSVCTHVQVYVHMCLSVCTHDLVYVHMYYVTVGDWLHPPEDQSGDDITTTAVSMTHS